MTRRATGIILVSACWLFFLFTGISELHDRSPIQGEWIGLGVGILWGIPLCLHIRRGWDPYNVEAHRAAEHRHRQAVPFTLIVGALVSAVVPMLLGVERTRILSAAILTSVFILFTYMLVRFLRDRPAD